MTKTFSVFQNTYFVGTYRESDAASAIDAASEDHPAMDAKTLRAIEIPRDF